MVIRRNGDSQTENEYIHNRLQDKDTKCQKTGLRFRVSIQYSTACAKLTSLEWSSIAVHGITAHEKALNHV